MKNKLLKDQLIQNGLHYCDDHIGFVEYWERQGLDSEQEIEEYESKTHYWICVVKCCKKLAL